jgi:hypothetical protein
VWPLVVGLILVGVAAVVGWWAAAGSRSWTDGGSLRVNEDQTRIREVVWSPPIPLAIFHTNDQQYEPSISPDGDELYFVRGRAGQGPGPGYSADIYVSYHRNGAWTAAVPVDAVNSDYDDLGPRVTADGRFLLFYSNRPGGLGGYDIWAAPRLPGDGTKPGGWGKPFNLGPGVNSEFDEYNPDPSPDGQRLYFSTNRKAASREQNQPWRATIRAAANADFDLWYATRDARAELPVAAPTTNPTTQISVEMPAQTQPSDRAGSAGEGPQADKASLVFSNAVEVPGVNTPSAEGASCMSPAGDFLYFASDRPGGFGKFDIYRCRVLPDGGFGPVENLGPAINTSDNETDPQLALNGFRLYFSSDRRPGDLRGSASPRPSTGPALPQVTSAQAPAAPSGGYDLLQSDSREVYSVRAGHPLPHLSLSWLVLVLSLLALVPLVMFMRKWDDQRLNLLQKCLLVSLLVHVLITLGLSMKKVTTDVIHYVRQEQGLEPPVDVTLTLNALPGQGDEVGAAVRQQASADVPAAPAQPNAMVQQVPGAETLEAPSMPANMRPAVPQVELGAPEVLVQVEGPKTLTPQPKAASPAPPVPSVLPQAPGVDLQLAAEPHVSQAEVTPTPAPAPAPAARLDVGQVLIEPKVNVPQLNAGEKSAPAAVQSGSIIDSAAAVAHPAAPAINVAGPTVATPPSDAVVTIEAPQPIEKVTSSEAATVANPVGSVPRQSAVQADHPAAIAAVARGAASVAPAARAPTESLVGAAVPHLLPASSAIAASASAPNGPQLPPNADMSVHPALQLPGPAAGSLATNRPDSPEVAELFAGASRSGPAAGPGGPAALPQLAVPASVAPLQTGANESLASPPRPITGSTSAASATSSPVQPASSMDLAVRPTFAAAPAVGMARVVSSAQPDSPTADEAAGALARHSTPTATTQPALAELRATGVAGAKVPTATGAADSLVVASAVRSEFAGAPAQSITPAVAAGVQSPTARVEVASRLVGAVGSVPEASPTAAEAAPANVGPTARASDVGAPEVAVAGAPGLRPPAASNGTADQPGSSSQSLAAAASVPPREVVSGFAGKPDAAAMTGIPVVSVSGPMMVLPKIESEPTAAPATGETANGPSLAESGPIAVSRAQSTPGAKEDHPVAGVMLASAGVPGISAMPPSKEPDPAAKSLDTAASKTLPRTVSAPAVIAPEVTIALPKLAAPQSLFQRSPEQRKPLVEKRGGTPESEGAVDRALAYLSRQQEPDGRWAVFNDDSMPGKRRPHPHDMACTGLATLAFLTADNTPAKQGPYRATVARAVEFLIDLEGLDGDMRGPRRFRGAGADEGNMYDQGICTMALCEAALMTGDRRYAEAALRAANFIVVSQNPRGGWRYLPAEAGDTSVLGWQMLALHDAEQLGFKVPEQTRARAQKYLKSASQGKTQVLASYMPGEGPSSAMTAEALFARLLMGNEISAAQASEVCQYLTRQMPDPGNSDFYFWYYASLSLSQMPDLMKATGQATSPEGTIAADAWKKWNEQTRDTLIKLQKKDGPGDGCWGDTRWTDRGGRVFSTSLATLTLEVYYRYLPLRAPADDDEPAPAVPPAPGDDPRRAAEKAGKQAAVNVRTANKQRGTGWENGGAHSAGLEPN